MPQLVVFTPCEKVIIAKDDNSPTLVSVFHSLKLSLEGKSPAKDGATMTLPFAWATYVTWRRLPGEEGRAFDQKIELIAPSRRVLMVQSTSFTFEKAYHRHSGRVFGFPFTESGDHILRISIKPRGETEYSFSSDFPLAIQIAFSSAPTVA
jgi:hypothetical protein